VPTVDDAPDPAPAPRTDVEPFGVHSRLLTATLATFLVAVGLVLDQLTKAWAIDRLVDQSIPLVPTVSLRLVYNPGMAFGMGAEIGPALTVVLLLVVAGLIAWLSIGVVRRKPWRTVLPVAIVIGGATGNLVDRVFRATEAPLTGHVVDFIAVDWFAIFNVGDIFAVCGAILWAVLSVARDPRPVPTRPAD